MARQTTAERFWQKVNTDGPLPTEGTATGQCWIWTAAVNSKGYGSFWTGDRVGLAHRWSYEHHTGAIPAELVLDHLCRRRHCVRPSHLQAVTGAENTRRGISGLVNGARQRAKTHCPAGHSYDEQNTKINSRGDRQCKACHTAQQGAYQRTRYTTDPEYRERMRAKARESMRRSRARRRAAEQDNPTTREAA